MLNRLTSAGGIAGLLSAASIIAGLFGKSHLSSFLGSADTAQVVSGAFETFGTIGAVVAGFLPHKKAA